MPNCDWGKPCECSECRTYEAIACPQCSFENIVEIVYDVANYFRDRKGLGYYEFSLSEELKKSKKRFNLLQLLFSY